MRLQNMECLAGKTDFSMIYLQKTVHPSFQFLQLFALVKEKTVETIQTQQQKAKRANLTVTMLGRGKKPNNTHVPLV